MIRLTFILLVGSAAGLAPILPVAAQQQEAAADSVERFQISSPLIHPNPRIDTGGNDGVKKINPPEPIRGIYDSLGGRQQTHRLDDNQDYSLLFSVQCADRAFADSIASFLRSRHEVLLFCFKQVEKRYPGIQGLIKIQVMIGETGKVQSNSGLYSTFDQKQVSECIFARFKWFAFPARPAGAGPLQFAVSLWLGLTATADKIP